MQHALLAAAVGAAGESRRGQFLAIGLAVALTPTALYLFGMLNPNGVEIAAAVLTWIAAIAFVLDSRGPASGRQLRRVAIGASVLVVTRGLSPLWLAVVAASILGFAGWRQGRELLRDRHVWIVGAAIGVASAVAMAWIVAVGTLDVTGRPLAITTMEAARKSLDRTPMYLNQMVFGHGFLDVPAPSVTLYLWWFAAGAVVLLGWAAADRRTHRVVAGLGALVLLLPILLEARQAPSVGFFWLGRYILPVAAGIPIAVAAWLGATGDPARVRSFARVVLVVTALAQVAAYVATVRRYAVGTDGRLLYLTGPHWAPTIPGLLLLLVFLAGTVGLCVVLDRTVASASVADQGA